MKNKLKAINLESSYSKLTNKNLSKIFGGGSCNNTGSSSGCDNTAICGCTIKCPFCGCGMNNCSCGAK